jgi:3-hydroxyacyl-CoA dehydrogenase/enoyl-CoA hydratase/3-hydroxybutyryl-CoA epimerase
MSYSTDYKNIQCEIDADQVLWVGLDRHDSSVNSLGAELFAEIDQIVDEIAEQNPKAVIFYSLKKSGFIAGADVSQFTMIKTYDEAYEVISKGQHILDKLEALPMPTVCMIHGFAIGGGCELALACDYRVADDSPKTVIGLPEVKLGIHPGWGGTVRLPKLIGAKKAMGIILPGRILKAKQAAKIGLVDKAVPTRQLKNAAKYYALNKPKKHEPSFLDKLSNSGLIRPLLAKVMRKSLQSKIQRSHYPAPYQAVDNWEKVGLGSKAMETEAKTVSQLLVSETAKNLVKVFFMQDRLKGLAKKSDFKPKHVHVVGAGTMGGDIAAWCALKGMKVTLQDQSPERIAPALKRADKLFQKKLRNKYLVQAAKDRLQPDVDGYGIGDADVIIEAIFENLEVKQNLFKALEEKAKPEAILATNTSSIPLDSINTVMQDPSRLVGIHFFNPVAQMMLVEVVQGDKTSENVAANATAFVGKISKLPLPVSSAPGFLVNRVLMPYLMEAMLMYDEGVDKVAIDKAAKNYGMPMGPITLADTVGLDVCLAVANELSGHYGGKVPQTLIDIVEKKNFGKKSGQGFYNYKDGKKQKPTSSDSSKNLSQKEITDRLIYRMFNESAACLREGVVADSDLLDAGLIFGTGFAPFKAGPMHAVEAIDKYKVVERLGQLSETYGDRFKPDAYWSDA